MKTAAAPDVCKIPIVETAPSRSSKIKFAGITPNTGPSFHRCISPQ